MQLQRLQEQLAALEIDRKNIADSGVDTYLQDATIREVKAHIAELESQQNLQERIEEQVKESGFLFDTIEVDGLTMPEVITDDWQYNQARKGVQNLAVSLTTTYFQKISELQAENRNEVQELNEKVTAAEEKADQLQRENKDLEVRNYELGLENDELSEKVRKGADLLHEANLQLEQKNQHILDLQNQIALGIRGSLNVVNQPQDTSKMAADIIASKPRITDVKFKDEYGIDRRTKTAIEVLTGKEIEYQEYVEKRYIILSLEEAAQYRAEHEQKQAELEAQNAVIPTIETDIIEYVTEQDETATDKSPNEEEIRHAAFGGPEETEGNTVVDEMVGKDQESAVDYECTSLATTDKERIIELEKGLDLANELLFDLKDRVEIIERYTQAVA